MSFSFVAGPRRASNLAHNVSFGVHFQLSFAVPQLTLWARKVSCGAQKLYGIGLSGTHWYVQDSLRIGFPTS